MRGEVLNKITAYTVVEKFISNSKFGDLRFKLLPLRSEKNLVPPNLAVKILPIHHYVHCDPAPCRPFLSTKCKMLRMSAQVGNMAQFILIVNIL